MANRIPLVVVSSEQLIKELPATDDLDLGNSSIQNANVVNATTLIGTTANLTTVNSTTLIGTTANLTTTNTNSFIASAAVIAGTTTIQEILEKAEVSATAMDANANVDILTSAVVYYTANSTANCTLNIRGNSTVALNTVMSTNQSLSLAFVVTNNANAYSVNNVHIDGVNTVVKWSGGSAPTGSANSVDAYSFTVIKTGVAAEYTLLGSKTQFA